MTDFWRSYFTLWSLFIIVFGFVLVGAGLTATDGIATLIFGIVGATDIAWTPVLRFAVALMGAVTLGWGMTLLVAIRAAIALGDQGATVWRGILLAMMVWWVLDSAMSVATGFWLNAVSNSLILAVFVIGLIGSSALRRPRIA